MEQWIFEYKGNSILVCNARVVELYVNGELQDSLTGFRLMAELKGRLPSGERIYATLYGALEVECTLIVGEQISPVKSPER